LSADRGNVILEVDLDLLSLLDLCVLDLFVLHVKVLVLVKVLIADHLQLLPR